MNWRVIFMGNRKLQPVSFNLDDPFEVQLLNYAKEKNFSRYVKRLIQRDKEGAPINQSKYESQQLTISKPKGKASSFI